MPTLSQSRMPIDPDHYRRIDPQRPVGGPERPIASAPQWPIHIRQSPVMISSLPSISTNGDGLARQFYGGANVPTRRAMLS